MISVILYGRNDTHGYNLHKRAAISLNCIAELLSDPNDEIVFVDYNTPNDLPTFIEAIYDTLTSRAKGILRVLRVRPHIHNRLYGKRTHLTALEPIARNIAIRRSNPQNRWILSTNTDMVFVPKPGIVDMTAAVADLPDGHYVLPRFDLPESLWEGWPRSAPVEVIKSCDQIGKALHLNEISVTYPYMRFDSPGDFQLIPRKTLFEVFGFDERMIHGWHVDSNMCRRLSQFFGQTDSLAERLKGYHCDHTRVTTLVHRLDLKLENDPHEFVFDLEDPYAGHQATSWGLPGETIEEIDFVNGSSARFVAALQASLGRPQEYDYWGDTNEVRNYVCYRSEHVLPYLAGHLTACPRTTRILYVGGNKRMLRLFDSCLSHMNFVDSLDNVAETMSHVTEVAERGRTVLRAPDVTDEAFGRDLITNYDVLVFDFGFDAVDAPVPVARVTDWPRSFRNSLGRVARLLEVCAEQCHERFASEPATGPDFIVLNANPWVFGQFVSQFLLTTQTPYNTQIRKGKARMGHDRLYRSHRWRTTEQTLRFLFGYDIRNQEQPRVRPGQSIDLTTWGDGSLHKDGHWGAVDFYGTWTDGYRAHLLLTVDPAASTADLLTEVTITEAFAGPDAEPVRVNVLFEGACLARWSVDPRYGAHSYPFLLPHRLFAGRDSCRLTFEIENPQSPALVARASGRRGTLGEDPRELGIRIESVNFHSIERVHYRLDSLADFTTGGRGAFYMNSCWTKPDNYGAWTLGPQAGLTMYLEEVPETPVMAVFTISDAAVAKEFPHIEVDVLFNGEKVDRWGLGPSRVTHERKVVVKSEILTRERPFNILFHIRSPRSPADLKWSDDPRPLGFRLTRLRLSPVQIPKYNWGQTIDFTENGNADPYLGSNWGMPDKYGRWTEGEEAKLVLRPDQDAETGKVVSFLISDCMVDRQAPRLAVQVVVNDKLADEWMLGPSREPHIRAVKLGPEDLKSDRDLVIAFRVPEPRAPASLGWSGDTRSLGIRLALACIGCDTLPLMAWATHTPGVRTAKQSEQRKGPIAKLTTWFDSFGKGHSR